ncbi:MAG TPA: hypothetical protein VMV14_08730 [Acidimicrobiales bacterium]|nr:hypothetical protein [Acidimicrobiales bacterium]
MDRTPAALASRALGPRTLGPRTLGPRTLASRALAAVLVAGAVLAGCGGSGGPVSVGPAQSGQTVTVTQGQKIVVTLPGTNWTFNLDPPFGPLAETSSEVASRRSSTVTAVFLAGAKGGATIDALPCASVPCRAGKAGFVLHVVVQS